MQIRVSGVNIEAGESFKSYAEEHLKKMVAKFFDKAVGAEVHLKKEGQLFKVVLVINEGVKHGIIVKSDGEAGDAYGALNEASKRAETQLRRYKGRIKDYRASAGIKALEVDTSLLNAIKYVIPPMPYDVFEEIESAEKNSNKPHNHRIIEEKTTEIETLSVDEAIMKMDLANLPALVFINNKNKRLNVVYHRKDGNISLIDPQV